MFLRTSSGENDEVERDIWTREAEVSLSKGLFVLPDRATLAVWNRQKEDLPRCSVLNEIASMEQEIDCKMPSISR
jgi:hypothetical protein